MVCTEVNDGTVPAYSALRDPAFPSSRLILCAARKSKYFKKAIDPINTINPAMGYVHSMLAIIRSTINLNGK